jgi:hypothetical protein
MSPPIVFISYSWDSNEHKKWVINLADFLIKNGVDVILDQYELDAGNNMINFMELSVNKADKVLMIMTPNYKLKSTNRSGGTGFEYSLSVEELYESQTNNKKFIPVLREGDKDSSIPGYLKSLIYHDMTNNDRFLADAFNLIRLIHEEPELKKPKLGNKPDFSNVPDDPILEMAQSIDQLDKLEKKKKAYSDSYESRTKLQHEIQSLFNSIISKAKYYKEKGELFFNTKMEQDFLILNTNGAGITIGVNRGNGFSVIEVKINIRVFNRGLSFDQGAFYFPGEEPKNVATYQFGATIDDSLNIIWNNRDHNFPTSDLEGFVFSKLLEQKKKNIERN